MSIYSKLLGLITDKQVQAITHANDPNLGNPFATMNDIGGASYKSYTALISQSSTNAPTATVLQNTLGQTPTFAYSAIGQYTIVVTDSLFVQSKTFIMVTNWGRNPVKIFWNDANTLVIRTSYLTAGDWDYQDGVLNNTSIEIRVYS